MDYANKATEARKEVLGMIHRADTSHIGSNFSCIDILTVLYNGILNVDAELKEDRDRMVYSKGWASASAYYFLAQKGIIPKEDLLKFGQEPYLGLVETTVRGIESAGGSMGYGLPFGVGFALAKKLKDEKGHVYVLMSDGEQAIGTTWESAMLASHHKLDNLTVIIDYNKFQAMGRTNEVLNVEPLADKWRAFGWYTWVIDGHNHQEIEEAFKERPPMPMVIIANTIKGKGVSFMQDKLEWHYKNVNAEDYEKALIELNG